MPLKKDHSENRLFAPDRRLRLPIVLSFNRRGWSFFIYLQKLRVVGYDIMLPAFCMVMNLEHPA
jgi:hypothetical protein